MIERGQTRVVEKRVTTVYRWLVDADTNAEALDHVLLEQGMWSRSTYPHAVVWPDEMEKDVVTWSVRRGTPGKDYTR